VVKKPKLGSAKNFREFFTNFFLEGFNFFGFFYISIPLIDPAIYYGHREAELAMTKLFGGFSNSFYEGYNENYPLKPEWEYREGIYTLYHVLNHLNLLGSGYRNHAVMLMKQYM